jgi:hypothetical protein
MRHLFISFTGTIEALASGVVRSEDLDTGLFVFACAREHFLNPGGQGEYVKQTVADRPDLVELLQAAVLKAEKENRVRWRKEVEMLDVPGNPELSCMRDDDYAYSRFRYINELMSSHGEQPLITDKEYKMLNPNYRREFNYDSAHDIFMFNYPVLEKRCKGVKVIWHG